MVCYSPLKGWRSRKPTVNGKYGLTFKLSDGYHDQPMEVPCGQCVGCRLERSRQWAMRCMHEAQVHENNCFITLTYDNENLPADKSLKLEDFQKFMKRLRKKYGPEIRFYHCGEYGDKHGRPHYHAILFNHDFSDRTHWSTNNGYPLYISAELQHLWPYGYSSVADVTFDSAAYVARYVMKKITGEKAEDHYARYCQETGEYLYSIKPEYNTMSRRPGIGKTWYEKHKTDVYPHDYVVVNGKKMKPPKYYDAILAFENEVEYNEIKRKRKLKAKQLEEDNNDERLAVKERKKLLDLKKLKRPIGDQ